MKNKNSISLSAVDVCLTDDLSIGASMNDEMVIAAWWAKAKLAIMVAESLGYVVTIRLDGDTDCFYLSAVSEEIEVVR